MQKEASKKVVSMILTMMLFLSVFMPVTINADAVTVSKKEYMVIVKGAQTFISNKKPVASEIGTEIFMTYTVESVIDPGKQQGLVATTDYNLDKSYPYTNGVIRSEANCPQTINLFEEGATYFVKFTIAEGTFRYNITKAKDDKLEPIVLESHLASKTTGLQYFGLWSNQGTPRMILSHVRCYDANGNDLGVRITDERGVVSDETLKKNKKIPYEYEVTATNASAVALGHIRKSTTKKVYMEYKVESVDAKYKQEGTWISNQPTAGYPYSKGVLRYNAYKEAPETYILLEKGAEYILCFEKTEKDYTVCVKKTLNGVTTYHTFNTRHVETYDKSARMFGLWFGSGAGSFHLTNVKFYDGNNNNLGVQSNYKAVVTRRGPLEDYAGCEATYYCKQNGDVLALYANKTFKLTVDKATQEGTYKIYDTTMTAQLNNETKEYEYKYARMTDSEGNKYERLYNYKVTFVTGTDEQIETQELNNMTGYLAMKPTEPKMEGYEFEEWVLRDGTSFDFDRLVTESTTLYAKYTGEGGTVIADKEVNGTVLVIATVGAFVVLAGVAIGVTVAKKRIRRKKHE